MGNTLFTASVMLMAISVSVMVATAVLREPAGTPGARLRIIGAWILALAAAGCWMSVLTVQLLGLTFTFSRGPWLGTLVALLGFLGLAATFVGWRALVRGTLVLALPAVLILALADDATPLARTFFLQGLAYRDLGQLEQSIQSLNRSLELSPSRETVRQAHQTLSEVYAKLGRDGLAKTHRKLYNELGRP